MLSLVRACGAVAALAACLILPASAAALPSTPDQGVVVTNGPVNAIVQAGGKTYLGGDFTLVGTRTGGGVALPATGSVSGPPLSFPEVVGGDVNAVVADGFGGWYLGGSFSSVGGYSRSRIAHVCADGSVDQTFAPLFNGTVRAFALPPAGAPDDSVLYVGGSFTQVGPKGTPYIAPISVAGADTCAAAGTVVSGWASGADSDVNALALAELPMKTTGGANVTEPLLFAGGSFTKIGSPTTTTTTAGYGAIWGVSATNADGTAMTSQLSPASSYTASGGIKRAVAISAPHISGTNVVVAVYWGGDPNPTIPGDANGLVAQQFSIAQNGRSSAFISAYTTWNNAVAPKCPTNPVPAPWCSGTVRSLALAAGSLFVGGDFGMLGSTARRGAAAISAVAPETTTSPATFAAWDPKPDGPVRGLATHDNTVYISGDFTHITQPVNVPRGGLAAISYDTGTVDPDWNPSPGGGPVRALALAQDGSSIFLGGSFTALGAQPRHHLAAIDADGSLDPAFAACSSPDDATCGADAKLQALTPAPDGLSLVAGGAFSHLGGAERGHLGGVDLTTGAVTGWTPPPLDGWVLALAGSGSTIYAGGSFEYAGTAPRSRAAAFDGGSGALLGWNPNASDSVRALYAACGTVYAGGSFWSPSGDTTIGGASRNFIAALDPVSGTATGWDPDANSTVYAIQPAGDVVFAGGQFSAIGGAFRGGLAALDATTGGSVLGWNPFATTPTVVRALALSGSAATLYVGGDFTTVSGAGRSRLAELDVISGATTDWNPHASDVPGETVLALAASGDNLYAGGSFRRVGAVMQQGFARFTGGLDMTTAVGCPSPPPEPPPPPPPPPPPEPPPPPPVPDTVAPLLGTFDATPARFRVAGVARRDRSSRTDHGRNRPRPRVPVGTTFRFSSSEAGQATILIERRLPGRMVGTTCVRPTRALSHARRCALYTRAGSVSRQAVPGVNSFRFDGRIGGKALRPGPYRATLQVTDAAGNASQPRRFAFTTAL